MRDKPQAFLEASPSATVPCLVAGDVLDESLDIMLWALGHNDPEGLMAAPAPELIAEFDGPFKRALDLTKYAVRYPDSDPEQTRAEAMEILGTLEGQLADGWLFGDRPHLPDLAILPFVRRIRDDRQTALRYRGHAACFRMVRDVFGLRTSGKCHAETPGLAAGRRATLLA